MIAGFRSRLDPPARASRVSFLTGLVLLVVVLMLTPGPLFGSARPTSLSLGPPGATHLVAVPSAGAGPTGPARSSAAAHPFVAAPTWINVTRAGRGVAPPTGYGESVSYDPVDHVTVLFGGCLSGACPSNQTWVFTNGTWTNVTHPSGSPSPRQFASMDFDPNMGGVLLFGGEAVGGVLLNDTWLYHGGIWTNLNYVGGGPAPRFAASMTFDPAPEENGSVLYGGCVPVFLGDSCFNDTWVWEGWSGWVRLTPSVTPPGVGFAAMTYDPAANATVLFGGCAGTFCFGFNNQTWELYSGQWWQVTEATFPSGRAGASMAYDPIGRQLLLFGGIDVSLAFKNDTWNFSGGTWHTLSPASGPSPRADFGLAWDPTGSALLLVGGETNGPNENDTWVYEAAPSVTLTPAATAAETSQSVGFTASVAGGTAAYDLLITFGDGTSAWVSGTGPTFPVSHAYSQVGTYVASVNLTDSVGVTANASTSSIAVSAGPAITAQALPSSGDVGIPLAFQVNVTSPGTPPLTYAWQYGDGSIGSGATASHAYSAPGVYRVIVNATDSLGGTATYSLTVTVVADPSLAVSLLPSQPNTSTLATLHAAVSGGTAPFQFSWRLGDGNSSVVPSPVHRFARAGAYTANVWVNDSVGASVHGSTTFTVALAPPPTNTTPPPVNSTNTNTPSGTPIWFWPGLAGIVAVGAVGTVVLLRRHSA